MKINIKEVEKGQLIRFGDHSHIVINEEIDCSGLLGEVVEIDNFGNPDNLEIQVKLKSNQHEEILSDWDNCLVFLFPDDDFFNDVEVTIINAKKCGDDKSIPKETHERIKLWTDTIMDIDQDTKWADVYSMFEDIYKEGKSTIINAKGENND